MQTFRINHTGLAQSINCICCPVLCRLQCATKHLKAATIWPHRARPFTQSDAVDLRHRAERRLAEDFTRVMTVALQSLVISALSLLAGLAALARVLRPLFARCVAVPVSTPEILDA